MKTAVVLDLDGTLVDSLHDIAVGANACLAAHGLPQHPVLAYRRFVGGGSRRTLACAAPDGADLDALVADFHRHYAPVCLERTRPYDGIVEMLATLSAQGHTLAVLSNKPHDLTQLIVAALFADVPFVEVLGAQEGIPKKPDPTSTLALCARLGISPSRTWFVGDTPADVGAANRAGAISVGVTWGFRSVEELQAHGVRHLCHVPADVARCTQP